MVTRRKRWSTNSSSGWPRGSSLVVQVSGGALTRTSSVASTIKIKSKFSRKLRVDTIFEQGLAPCSFFSRRFFSRRSQATMMASSNPIERSFELAAERCEDLTPLVYRRLFDAHPEARTMFRTEGSELVKGSMLALTIDAILDFAGERTGHFRLIDMQRFPRTTPTARRANCSSRSSASSRRRCAKSSERTGRTRSMRRGGNCSATSKVSLQRSERRAPKLLKLIDTGDQVSRWRKCAECERLPRSAARAIDAVGNKTTNEGASDVRD